MNPGPTFPSSPFRVFMSCTALFPWYCCISGGVDCSDVDCGGVDCGGIDCDGVDCGDVDCGDVDCGDVDCGGVDCGGIDCDGVDCGGVDCGGIDCDGVDCGDVVIFPARMKIGHKGRDEYSTSFCILYYYELSLIHISEPTRQA